MVIDSDVGCNRSIDFNEFSIVNQYNNSFDFTVFPCAFIFVDSFILFRSPSCLISLWMEPKRIYICINIGFHQESKHVF